MANTISNGTTPPPDFQIYTSGPKPSGPNPFYFLSPDALMSYIEQELEQIDRGVFKEMEAIKLKNELSQKLSSSTSFLESLKNMAGKPSGDKLYQEVFGQTSSGGNGSPAANGGTQVTLLLNQPVAEVRDSFKESVAELKDAAAALRAQGHEEEAKQLETLAGKIEAGHLVSVTGEINAALSSIKNAGESITRSNDLSMINLQQSMERRSRALTFISNALKAMDAPQNQAIRNMV